PAEKQLFLLQTSILDRFCASLCQAVIMVDSPLLDAQATLQELEATNVFTIPLDDSGHWFRYHHLFDEFLQMRLHEGYSTEVVAALHVRASAWFAEHGFIEEALKHALIAGEKEAAIQIVAANRQELMNEEHFQRLWRWLQQFPQHIIEESPDLLLIQARSAQIQRFDMAEVIRIADKVDVLVNALPLEPQKAERISAETGALRSASHYFALDPKAALACCRNGLEIMPRQWYALRSYCWIYGAAALQMMGDLSGAYDWIQQGRCEDVEVRGGPQARNAIAEGFVSWMAADLASLQRVGEFALRVSTDSRWHSLGWAHYFLACVHYHRNDLDSALYHAKKTFDRRYVNHALANVYSAFIMAMIQQARGEPEVALETVALAADYANEIRSTPFILMVQSFQAELAVLQGRARELLKWEEQACLNVQLSAMPFFYAPPLTIPKVLLAIGTPGSLVKAADCLQRLHAFAESTHNTRVLIEVLALEAMLHAANQNEEAALEALEESLALAQPGGFIRLYVDLGPKMAELLRHLHNREPYSEYVTNILGAFADTARLNSEPAGNGQLIEPLTERELEILALLGKRYSNKEIAAELVISPETVKRHAINI
ncbi:MAG: LuxR C-terminal-related transcriptional regulator, partial [Candidatus Promineifilaceae bacterium]